MSHGTQVTLDTPFAEAAGRVRAAALAELGPPAGESSWN